MTHFADRNDVDVEQGLDFAPKFDDQGLITAVAVDHQTNDVLMVAFMNAEALAKTIEIGEAVYYSRIRKRLWHKGEESGNTQKVVQILTDCDQDCLVLKVEQVGGAACHNGYRSCFYRAIDGAALQQVLNEKVFDPDEVYGKK